MPVPDQVRDDGSGIQNILKLLNSGVRRNDKKMVKVTFYETIKSQIFYIQRLLYLGIPHDHFNVLVGQNTRGAF